MVIDWTLFLLILFYRFACELYTISILVVGGGGSGGNNKKRPITNHGAEKETSWNTDST